MKKFFSALIAVVATVSLSACSTPAADNSVDTSTSFPVTIGHAFGETTIESSPERVVAWGWGAADAAIALGVIPVGIPAQVYGGDENGLLPWIGEAVEAAGAEMPTLLSETDGIPPYEAIAALEPDLILSPYSGMTQEQYEILAKIAPVVAYPEAAWSTPWQEVITITGKALGLEAKAATLLESIDAQIAAKAAEHPEFAGKTIAQIWDVAGTVYVYRAADARVGFVEDLGFTTAPSVEQLASDESPFYFTLSTERLDELESDVVLVYGTTDEELNTFLNSSYAKLMPQITEGNYASLTGATIIASVSPPTALSLTWGLDQFVDALAKAVE